AKESGYQQEVELLANLNVDGVITTNWDMFIEQLFPEYTTYVGQEELLFSNPQEIGEIYKIHGCSTNA
ncbi:SIR2 family protein, partial [Vibrio parahaemolyticus]